MARLLPAFDPSRPERLSRHGEVLLTLNHLVLLQGLYDRPDGVASSYKDWIAAATPHFARLCPGSAFSNLVRSTRTLHPRLVQRHREGTRFVCTLTTRGRGVLERSVAAHVIGEGPYRGVRTLLRE